MTQPLVLPTIKCATGAVYWGFPAVKGLGNLSERMVPPNPLMPRFDAPPVVETVMGVHFQALPDFHVAARALFWSRLRDHFPSVEEKSPLPEAREGFAADRIATGVRIRWQLSETLPSPRLWAKSADGKHTIQIQQDGLFVNWERNFADEGPYWPYEDRRQDFVEKMLLLEQFLHENKIGELRPTTCFVTYINHIDYDDQAGFAPSLAKVLSVWRNDTTDGWLPPVEQASLQLAFAMQEEQGRLHVSAVPAIQHRDNKRIIRLDITARSQARDWTVNEALSWMDLGHEWIVRGFSSLTRPEMHQIWRRTQ